MFGEPTGGELENPSRSLGFEMTLFALATTWLPVLFILLPAVFGTSDLKKSSVLL